MSPLVVYESRQDVGPGIQLPDDPLAATDNDPFGAVHADMLAALGAGPPQPLPICPQVRDLEDRQQFLRGLLSATHAYLRAVLGDVAQNVPRDLDLRSIEALRCDLQSEVMGAMQLAAAALESGRR